MLAVEMQLSGAFLLLDSVCMASNKPNSVLQVSVKIMSRDAKMEWRVLENGPFPCGRALLCSDVED